jgi:hypothetical protein
VADAHLAVRGGYYASPSPHPLALERGLPVDLGGGTNLAVQVSQQYRLIESTSPREPWRVTIVAYFYTLQEAHGSEILSYQWHPTVPESVTYPHLHLGYAAAITREELHHAHLPTGRVALEDFVRLLIEAFTVPPARENWEEVLAQSRAEFDADRSW